MGGARSPDPPRHRKFTHVAAIIARRLAQDPHADTRLYQFAIGNYGIMSVIALAVLVAVMIFLPLANAGRPEDPAPPTAIM